MDSIVLAYNKLSVSTLSTVFKEIEKAYEKNRKDTSSMIIKILSETELESNLLAISSLLKLIYSALDKSIVEEIITKIDDLNLCCYIFNYGLVDDAFINSRVQNLLKKRDILSVLRILQMCSGILDSSTLSLIELGADSAMEEWERQEGRPCILLKFIKDSVKQIQNGRSPYRNYLQEEMNSVKVTISNILSKYTYTNTEVITTATDADELIAVKYGMNTSLKKKIFSIITSSTDYYEAQRSLYKQIIRKVWHIEEIVKISIRLCIAESVFNIYYPSLIISIYNSSSSSHKGAVMNYIYHTIDEQANSLSKKTIKEIYNLGMLIGHLYGNEVNVLKPLVCLSIIGKKEGVLIKVAIKNILTLYQQKKIKKIRKIKETERFREFFMSRLVDESFLKSTDQTDLEALYSQMFI
ncbi:hypothetical protein NEIRO03_1025 [Nematocida sp. AWRm78]|nr:hypothetical protein NEIRO02_1089 [Nematocida sp. AWRm79]KAI5183429.1 hypothetical protein NEIRO03_1025 [Nematocida sp. AWRm78]